ncbi:MAG: sugar ABC transporter ATP-binding protein [Janthinobacterium lividum]
MMSTPVMQVSGIGKTYAAPVLAGVDLTLFAGEVLALTGENGAGKSTLSKIIGGLETPTHGAMTFNGAPFAPGSRSKAEALGVRMVMQELNLLPTLTIAENLFFNQLPSSGLGWISRKRLRAAAIAAMARVGLDTLDPDTPVAALGIGHQQMVEIARNLIGDCRVLILDEPTAMLTGREVELLFEQVERLKRDGVSIIYISHRLEELARISNRIAVLRDGKLVSVGPIAEYTTDRLVTLMVGRDIGDRIDLGERDIGAPMFRVEHMTRGDVVKDVSFEVRRGEIFGISGLIGSGRTELLRLIFGADKKDAGTVSKGMPPQPCTIHSPVDAVRQRIALITEDRKGEGLLLTQPVASNLSLSNFEKVSRFGMVDGGLEQRLSKRQIDAMSVRCSGPAQPVGELSGGNQQKVVIGRWLERDCDVMLFDEPTRGIDVGAKFDIYALLGAQARAGKALVVVSSDMRELMLICDRIAVMSAGKLVRTFARGEWTQDSLLAAAFSGYDKADTADAAQADAAHAAPLHNATTQDTEGAHDARAASRSAQPTRDLS